MNKYLLALLLITSTTANAQQHVDGYMRKDGVYVQPHYRSANDGNPYNNYSTQGNYNPYSGKTGTVDPYNQNQYGTRNSLTDYDRRTNSLYDR